MGRLRLVIADNDKDYLKSLEKHLVLKYPQRFDIFSFLSLEKLTGFLSDNKGEILLINSKMYKDTLDFKSVDTVVLLSESDDEPVIGGFERVKKFQHTDRLMSDILRIYGAKAVNTCLAPGGKSTHIICVYSPAGGTGKTSIAVGCSILSAGLGLKTFYLNAENIPSTKLYFHGDTAQTFSNAIFHIKGNDKNLGIRLEGAKAYDQSRGVHFFAAPESILEMEELTASDIERLVLQLRNSRIYDVVFIDMSSGLNPRNIALLRMADAIVNVMEGHETSVSKMRNLMNGIDVLEQRNKIKIREKMITALNKCDVTTAGFMQHNPVVLIGNYGAGKGKGGPVGVVEEPAFLSRLNRLLEHVLPKGSVRQSVKVGVS